MLKARPRRFVLVRNEDESGVSGTGIVAEGTQYASGTCTLSWLTSYQSIGVYKSAQEVIDIHGHGGKTSLVWVDTALDLYNLQVALHGEMQSVA